MISSSALRSFLSALVLLPLASVACGDDSGGAPATVETTTALESAQCTFKRDRAAEDACFQTYGKCLAADGADAAACRTALQSCLPKPPPRTTATNDSNGGGRGDGNRGGEGGGRGEGGGDRGDRTPPQPLPDPAIVAPCRASLDSCLTAQKGDQSPCFAAHTKCVDEAFRAAFQTECDTAIANCDKSEEPNGVACTALRKRCAEGYKGRLAPGATACPQ